MKKIFFIILFLILLAVVLMVFLGHKATSKSNKLTTFKLALDWSPNTNHTGVYAALAKGWYKKQGINLEVLPYSPDVSSVVLITSNKADVAVSSIEDVVGETAKNNPIISIGAILQHNTSGFIVLKDSGITRPRELDGKIYGGYGSPSENAIVTEIIKKDGGKGNFKDIVLDVDAMQALESKRINFVWVFSGWEVIQAKLDGVKFNYFPLTKYGIPDSPSVVFAATPEEIKNKSDLLKRFMSATAQGYEYARLHPKESAQLMINQNPKDTFPNPKLIFASQDFLSAHYADKNNCWGLQQIKSWQDYPKFILGSGSILDSKDKPVKTMNFNNLFTNKFLP